MVMMAILNVCAVYTVRRKTAKQRWGVITINSICSVSRRRQWRWQQNKTPLLHIHFPRALLARPGVLAAGEALSVPGHREPICSPAGKQIDLPKTAQSQHIARSATPPTRSRDVLSMNTSPPCSRRLVIINRLRYLVELQIEKRTK